MTADRTGCPGLDDDTTARRSRRRRRVVGALAGLTLAVGGAPATADAAGALNGRVGFTTFRFNGTGDIANMNPDGSNLRRLTTDQPGTPLYDAQSDWSPDGQRIAYRHENPTTRRFEVWTMDLYGNEQLGLVRGTQPSWAPDGKSMLFRDSGPQATDIFAMDTDGRNRRLAVTLPRDQLYPAYSPDMSRIVFASLHAGTSRRDRGIYTTDADARTSRGCSTVPAAMTQRPTGRRTATGSPSRATSTATWRSTSWTPTARMSRSSPTT